MADAQLKDFLERLGLAAHLDVFDAEEITFADLGYLSDADLVSLGLPLGPRRRLMRALDDTRPDAPAASVPSPVPASAGERRNLTVLFCDMVGSTALATRLDPEDLSALYRGFRETCVAAIEAEGGFVAHRLGDGLMAHFGYPRALEDAAIRAARAGLAIVAGVAALKAPGALGSPVQVRIGIATGLTVIEDLRSGKVAEDELATGATLSQAARLQALAPPDGVVVSDATRRLLRGTFDLEALGPQDLKGFDSAENVWRVRGHGGRADGQANVPRAPNRLVGRDDERAILLAHLQATLDGSGSTVVIGGEAGIGKSRLLADLRDAVPPEADTINLYCSRYRHGSALHPVIEWLRRVYGKKDGADLSAAPGLTPENVPYLEGLIGPIDTSRDPEADPLGRQQKIAEALASLLMTPARCARLLIVEDVHWADDATLDLLERLARYGASAPVMVVAASRTPFGRVPDGPGVRHMELGTLSEDATMALILSQSGADSLSDNLRRTIADRSGGIPFFVEELTRSVVEIPNADSAAIPITLQDTLMARLDRLNSGKPVAQVSALFGRNFLADLLFACSDLPEEHLRTGLVELVNANLIEARSAFDYAFCHALVRDAAYESMLRKRRIELHLRVARIIEAQFPNIVAEQPETVAHHYTMAGEWDPAIRLWAAAAEQGIAKAAPSSAIAYFGKAIELLGHLPDSAERDRREAALRVRLNMPLTVTSGFASAETEANLARLADLFAATETTEAALQLLWSRCMSALVRADLVAARTTAEQMRQATQFATLPNAARLPERILGYVAMLEGDLAAAEHHFDAVLDGYDPKVHDAILPGHPFDVLSATLAQRAILRALQDRMADMQRDFTAALDRSRALARPAAHFQVLVHLSLACFEARDYDRLMPLLVELREVVDRNEIAPLYADMWEAWLRARQGDLEDGLAGMRRAQGNAAQYPLWLPSAMVLEAELLREAGRPEAALAVLDDCDARIERHRHTYLLAETRRLRALCLWDLGASAAQTATRLERARETAERQGVARFALMARRDLDRLRAL